MECTTGDSDEKRIVVDISALPEGCIATALSLTTPKEACRLSLVASTFRSASHSDTVWIRFLPSDIISRAPDADSLLSKFHSKKDLYLHLSDHPILIDEGLKSFWVEKSSGKKCYMLAAKNLSIARGGDSLYWRWIKHPELRRLFDGCELRFCEVAELVTVCWFELAGKIDVHMLSCGTNYAAYLVFIIPPTSYGFAPHCGGASVGINGCECQKQSVYLDPGGIPWAGECVRRRGIYADITPKDPNGKYPKCRKDGWMEVELGEWFVNEGEDGHFEVRLVQNNSEWKSGLIIQGIEIRPKQNRVNK